MAIDAPLTLTPGQWVQLTNANATSCRVQNRSGYPILLQATAGAISPTGTGAAIELLPFQTLTSDVLFAHVWPGVAGANRLWGFAAASPGLAIVSVSHADA
jgi:hypothetical protein